MMNRRIDASVVGSEWLRGNRFVRIGDPDGPLLSAELRADWHDTGSRTARVTWVASWFDSENSIARRPLDAPAVPAETDSLRRAVVTASVSAAQRGALPPVPATTFSTPQTALTSPLGASNRIELTSLALQDAEFRVHESARSTDEWAPSLLIIRMTEWLAWLRAFDELLQRTWTRDLSPAMREAECHKVDRAIASYPKASQDLLIPVKERDRRARGRLYKDWTIALVAGAMPIARRDLLALRWLGGRMLHHGPLPAVRLEQSEPGLAPHWVWRRADDICPPEEGEHRPEQRAAYDTIAGRPLGQLLRTGHVAIEAEIKFMGMLERDGHRPSVETSSRGG